MAKLFIFSRRAAQSGGGGNTVGAASFAALQNAAVKLISLLDSRAGATQATRLTDVLSALVPAGPGAQVTASASGSSTQAVAPAAGLSSVYTQSAAAASTAAGNVVQLTFDLVGSYGAATATNVTVSGSDWQNTANATGNPNGSVAIHAGNVTAQDAYLNFAFPSMSNKTSLVISKVELRFTVAQSGTTLNNGNLVLSRGTSGDEGAQTLATFTGDLALGPQTFNITESVSTWAAVGAARARVRHAVGAGAAAIQAHVDAVQLVVTASQTTIQ